MPPERCESRVSLKKALRRLVIDEVGMDGSRSHATVHYSPDLHLDPLLDGVSHLKRAEEV